MTTHIVAPLLVASTLALCFAAPAHAADAVAGIALYPGASSSNVESSEKVLKDSGYPTAVCRHTADSVAKVFAFYRNDKQLQPLGEPTKDNAGFAGKAGATMSINSPWVDLKTLRSNNDTMICIVSRGGK